MGGKAGRRCGTNELWIENYLDGGDEDDGGGGGDEDGDNGVDGDDELSL